MRLPYALACSAPLLAALSLGMTVKAQPPLISPLMAARFLATPSTPALAAMPPRPFSLTPADLTPPPSRGLSRADILTVFARWRHTPYRLGGASRRGIDCSAFIRAVFREASDIELARDTRSQVKQGVKISKRALNFGDLVFFKVNRRLNHVGIYVGAGEFIHASAKKGVTRSKLNSGYWRQKFWQARRVSGQV
ncbi:MAG: C40 family peptidase [Aeromonas sp.]